MLEAGVNKSKMHLSAEAAFSINTQKVINDNDFFSIEKPIKENINISISVRKWSSKKAVESYMSNLIQIIQWLCKEYNANIYFLSTCTGFPGYSKDDRVLALEIKEMISEKSVILT